VLVLRVLKDNLSQRRAVADVNKKFFSSRLKVLAHAYYTV